MGRPALRATCDTGTRRWTYRYVDARCSPPPAACPASAPTQGARCDGEHPNGFIGEAVCPYGACTNGAVNTARCSEATEFTWQVAPARCM
jgi:hypothetical protein